MIPWFLMFFIFFVIMFQTRLKYNERQGNSQDDIDNFLREDLTANFSRAVPINDEMYVKIDAEKLPFGKCQNERVAEVEGDVRKNLSGELINTKMDSNIEVKKNFGLKNLQTVIEGEANFTSLIKNLNLWAKLLIEDDKKNDAKTILNAALESGSDISDTFILLYGLYKEENDADKIDGLLISVNRLSESAKNRVLKVIMSKEDV